MCCHSVWAVCFCGWANIGDYGIRSSVPKAKRAAVLVLLYEKSDVLRVLLTTRAKTLRTHPGQTALPGGKMDEEDEDIVETAVRPLCACGAM